MKLLTRENKKMNTIRRTQRIRIEENIIMEELIQESKEKIIINAKMVIPKDNKKAMKFLSKKEEKRLSILGEELRMLYKDKNRE